MTRYGISLRYAHLSIYSFVPPQPHSSLSRTVYELHFFLFNNKDANRKIHSKIKLGETISLLINRCHCRHRRRRRCRLLSCRCRRLHEPNKQS